MTLIPTVSEAQRGLFSSVLVEEAARHDPPKSVLIRNAASEPGTPLSETSRSCIQSLCHLLSPFIHLKTSFQLTAMCQALW